MCSNYGLMDWNTSPPIQPRGSSRLPPQCMTIGKFDWTTMIGGFVGTFGVQSSHSKQMNFWGCFERDHTKKEELKAAHTHHNPLRDTEMTRLSVTEANTNQRRTVVISLWHRKGHKGYILPPPLRVTGLPVRIMNNIIKHKGSKNCHTICESYS